MLLEGLPTPLASRRAGEPLILHLNLHDDVSRDDVARVGRGGVRCGVDVAVGFGRRADVRVTWASNLLLADRTRTVVEGKRKVG